MDAICQKLQLATDEQKLAFEVVLPSFSIPVFPNSILVCRRFVVAGKENGRIPDTEEFAWY